MATLSVALPAGRQLRVEVPHAHTPAPLYWDQQTGPSAVVVRKQVGILPTPASQEKMSPKRGGSTLKFRVINLTQ